MRNWAALVCVLLVCVRRPPQQRVLPPEFLFKDEFFAAPSERIVAADMFAFSDPMKRYLRTEIAGQLRRRGRSKA